MDRKTRVIIENHVKGHLGHTRQDIDGTKFLAKHGFGPTGKKRAYTGPKRRKKARCE